MVTEKQMANLKPVSSKSEARERGRNGGLKKKANEPLRKEQELKKQAFKEAAQETLAEMQSPVLLKMREWSEFKLEDISKLSSSDLEKILKFLEFLRDSSGQKPTDKQEVTTNQQTVINVSEKQIEEVLKTVKETTYE